MVLLSVALDRNHQVGIGEVHSGDEVALFVANLVLPFGSREPMSIQEVEQLSLERTARHGRVELALFQDLCHQSGSGPSLPSQTLEGFSYRPLGYQPATSSFVDGEVQPHAVKEPCEVDYRPRRICNPHAVEPAKVAAL
jgi:hypothetical protein